MLRRVYLYQGISGCVLAGTEVLHMDKNCKQQDINYIVELLQKECPEKVREVLVFIRSYLGD